MYVFVCVFCLYILFLALNKTTCVARRSHLLFQFFFSLVTRIEFISEPKELGFTLEPLVVFYSSFIPCEILSTESSRQILTFLLDRHFFASLRCDLVFMFCPKH